MLGWEHVTVDVVESGASGSVPRLADPALFLRPLDMVWDWDGILARTDVQCLVMAATAPGVWNTWKGLAI